MDKNAYEAIKLKLEQDRMEIEVEISELAEKRTYIEKQKKNEEAKLSISTKLLVEQKTVRGSMLKQTFNIELMKKLEKDLLLIEKFLIEARSDLEKVKEQEKYVDDMFRQKLKEKEIRERKKEEEMLFELKKWSGY